MQHYVLKDHNSSSKAMLIQTLQVILIKRNLLQVMCSQLQEELRDGFQNFKLLWLYLR